MNAVRDKHAELAHPFVFISIQLRALGKQIDSVEGANLIDYIVGSHKNCIFSSLKESSSLNFGVFQKLLNI